MTAEPESRLATDPPRTPDGSLGAAMRAVLGVHARTLLTGVATRVFVIMLLVEAVFIAERFPIVFREVFKNHADLFDATLILLCNTTQVFDLALAIAILLAVYWTLLQMRESRELLVLFAAGTGPYQLLAVALLIAVAGQVASLTVSGVLDPATRYAERRILFDAEFRALRNGINTGEFYTFPKRVAFAPARVRPQNSARDATRSLFVFDESSAGKFRVITADRAFLDGPDEAGTIRLKLGGFTSHTFASEPKPEPALPAKPPGAAKRGSLTQLSAVDVTQAMAADQLVTLPPRGDVAEELTIFEQVGASAKLASPRLRADMRLLGERFSRGLLCLLAPLMALAAVCLTFRGSNYFVLPLACLALMALNLMSGSLIKLIAPTQPLGALGAPVAVSAILAALLLAQIVREQGRLAQPQLARP